MLAAVIAECTEGADIYTICRFGDNLINEELKKVYRKKKDMEKGIAFPTCISCNLVCGHFSPMQDESVLLSTGDVAKM